MGLSSSNIVDFDAVKRNAADDGIPLSEIAIKYERLTASEFAELERQGLLTHALPDGGSALAKFATNGDALFPAKAVAVLHLAA